MRFFKYFFCKPVWGYGIVYDLRSYLFWPHSTYFAYLLMAGIAGLGAYLLFVFRIALIEPLEQSRRSFAPYSTTVDARRKTTTDIPAYRLPKEFGTTLHIDSDSYRQQGHR